MERLKNYGLWAAVFSLIPLFLESIGYNILPKNYQELVASILGILVLAGVINNPSSGTGYSDK